MESSQTPLPLPLPLHAVERDAAEPEHDAVERNAAEHDAVERNPSNGESSSFNWNTFSASCLGISVADGGKARTTDEEARTADEEHILSATVPSTTLSLPKKRAREGAESPIGAHETPAKPSSRPKKKAKKEDGTFSIPHASVLLERRKEREKLRFEYRLKEYESYIVSTLETKSFVHVFNLSEDMARTLCARFVEKEYAAIIKKVVSDSKVFDVVVGFTQDDIPFAKV